MAAPRAVLKALWGPLAGQKKVIAAGGSLEIGRAEGERDGRWMVAHDQAISDDQFRIDWDGQQARLRDLGSREGTEVDGFRFREIPVPLHDRAWIRAGSTDWVFRVESISPSNDADRSSVAVRAGFEILDKLRAEGQLWALVDASRAEKIFDWLEGAADRGRSLYEGIQGIAIERQSPFLIRFDADSKLLEALWFDGFDKGYATYLVSDESEKQLRRHFRRFLMVEAEGIPGRVYFRFYDPRVLRDFLALATPRQRAELLGPVALVLLPRSDGSLESVEGQIKVDESEVLDEPTEVED